MARSRSGSAPSVEVRPLPAAASDDGRLMWRITNLINDVYLVAEEGIWTEDATRTTMLEVVEMTRAGQLVLARLGDDIAGCARVRQLDEGAGELGMLLAAPSYRRIGVGRALVRYAEQHCRAAGLRTMRLGLLVPTGWMHPRKAFLAAWCTRLGYRITRIGTLDESHPALAPQLATPCDFVIYHKELATEPSQ